MWVVRKKKPSMRFREVGWGFPFGWVENWVRNFLQDLVEGWETTRTGSKWEKNTQRTLLLPDTSLATNAWPEMFLNLFSFTMNRKVHIVPSRLTTSVEYIAWNSYDCHISGRPPSGVVSPSSPGSVSCHTMATPHRWAADSSSGSVGSRQTPSAGSGPIPVSRNAWCTVQRRSRTADGSHLMSILEWNLSATIQDRRRLHDPQ